MPTDEQIHAYRAEGEARFDELREQRVLGRLRAARRGVSPRRRAIAVPLLAGVAVAAAVFLLVERFATPTSAPWLLADGSAVTLAEGAHVALARADGTAVRVLHTRGRARYDVTRRAHRSFEVVTPEATVRVRGTSFDVEALGAATEVRVHEGRVEVDDGARRVLLGAGEQLRVTRAAPRPVASVAPAGGAGASRPEPPASSAVVTEPARVVNASPVSVAEPALARTDVEPARPQNLDREALLAQADAARAQGALDIAARLYREAEALGTSDDRAEVAILLARIEARRGHPERAVRAYQRCLRHAPQGPHAQDALAGAALAWAESGEMVRAREAAADYLARWPAGLHDTAMQRLLAR